MAIAQRQKFSPIGSISPASARPATKLPDQNSAANPSATYGVAGAPVSRKPWRVVSV
jgi:hypothetical protein